MKGERGEKNKPDPSGGKHVRPDREKQVGGRPRPGGLVESVKLTVDARCGVGVVWWVGGDNYGG